MSQDQAGDLDHAPANNKYSLFCLVIPLLVIASGCGETAPERVATYPVQATVTFNGAPIPGAFLTLHPKQPLPDVPPPRASVAADGGLKVSTYDSGDGAPAGEYIVTVEWYKPIKNGPDVVPGPNVLPRKYASPQTSDLSVTITADTNQLPPIEL